jgi:hypothetical protein
MPDNSKEQVRRGKSICIDLGGNIATLFFCGCESALSAMRQQADVREPQGRAGVLIDKDGATPTTKATEKEK